MIIVDLMNASIPSNTTSTKNETLILPDGNWHTSRDPLPLEIRQGMAVMGTIGLFSTASTLILITFITYHMICWKRYYELPIYRNQVFILIYNLLLADFQQGMAFLLSFYWLSKGYLDGPNPVCWVQGWLISIGDMSSGLWVLSIAFHTFINVVLRKTIPLYLFTCGVITLWIFNFIISLAGPATGGPDFYVPTAAWCWISETHQLSRLYLHYVWIFMAQLGSLVIYFIIAIFFNKQIRGPAMNSSSHSGGLPTSSDNATTKEDKQKRDPFAASKAKILQTARYMVLYPIAYVTLTLPLAGLRVAAMTGNNPTSIRYLVAGSMMGSCGWVDVALYIGTRRVLVSTKKNATHLGLSVKIRGAYAKLMRGDKSEG